MDKLALEALVWGAYRTFYKPTIFYTRFVNWYTRHAGKIKIGMIAYFVIGAYEIAILNSASMFIAWLCFCFPLFLALGLDKMRSELSVERMYRELSMRGADFRSVNELKSYLKWIEIELK